MNGQRNALASYLALMLLGLTACSTEQSTSPQSSTDTSTVNPTKTADLLPLEDGLAIAEAEVGGKAYAVEREVEKNIPIIEVEIGDTEVLVNAETGEVISIDNLLADSDPEDVEEVAKAREFQVLPIITIQEAIAAAEAVTDEPPHTVGLENEEGNLVYEVAVGLQEIYVDAGNGEVLFVETEFGGDGGESLAQSSIQVPFSEGDDD